MHQTDETNYPLRVAVVTHLDVRDVLPLSGTAYFMIKALERQAMVVTPLGPVHSTWSRIEKRLERLFHFFGKGYDGAHSVAVSRGYAHTFESLLNKGAYDVIFAPMASTEIAFLETDLPIVYLTDMTFALARSYYDYYSTLLPFSERQGAALEKLTAQKATEIVSPSEWTARSFEQDYGRDAAHVHVIPFGANLNYPPTREQALKPRSLDVCRLLLLGVDWERKGGPIALAVLDGLVEAGIDAELTVCGCKPPQGEHRDRMHVIPFIRKDHAEGVAEFRKLVFASTFLLGPSKSEAAGIVFAEASAYGLPAITRDTGGVATMVRNGVNGYCLPSAATAQQYTQLILELIRDPERYRALCVSSRNEYETRLNWDVWATEMLRVMRQAVAQKRPSTGANPCGLPDVTATHDTVGTYAGAAGRI